MESTGSEVNETNEWRRGVVWQGCLIGWQRGQRRDIGTREVEVREMVSVGGREGGGGEGYGIRECDRGVGGS